jgi:catechol 2,3-dioxygenase-like lactoylglutathione lyase family enzyme
MIVVDRFDHLVLTVANTTATCDFYCRVLGMEVIHFEGRMALKFGRQKINIHERGHEIAPHAEKPTPGSADLCLIVDTPLDEVERVLKVAEIPVELGPVERTGATGKIRSLYVRDPDENLIELSHYL